MHNTTIRATTAAAALLALAGCGASTASVGSSGSGSPPTTPSAAAATATPLTSASPSATPPAATTVIRAASTAMGMAVVAASNGHTLYTFNSDTAASGSTGCNSGCTDEWPPFTVPAGTTPGGTGVSGRLGTIVRSDGRTQVTDNGRALYFFADDSGPAQTGGSYPGWTLARA